MARAQGLPKTGGRKKGTPNRRTINLTEQLAAVNFNIPERLVELLPQLSPSEQSKVLIDLMSFIYPKRKAIEVTEPKDPSDNKITIEFVESANKDINPPQRPAS